MDYIDIEKVCNKVRFSKEVEKARRNFDSLDENITEFVTGIADLITEKSEEKILEIVKLVEKSYQILDDISVVKSEYYNTIRAAKLKEQYPDIVYIKGIDSTIKKIDTINKLVDSTYDQYKDLSMLWEDEVLGLMFNSTEGLVEADIMNQKVSKLLYNAITAAYEEPYISSKRPYDEQFINNLHRTKDECNEIFDDMNDIFEVLKVGFTNNLEEIKDGLELEMPTLESITNGKVFTYKELNKLAEERGYKLSGMVGDHAKYIDESGNHIIIPQNKIQIGLHNKILKEIFGIDNETIQLMKDYMNQELAD